MAARTDRTPARGLLMASLFLTSLAACGGDAGDATSPDTHTAPTPDTVSDTAKDTVTDTAEDAAPETIAEDVPPPPPSYGDRPTFWYEDSNLARLEPWLAFMQEHRLAVHIGLHDREVDPDAVAQFLTAAAEHEVPVGIWPLLHPDDGYFPNVRNADAFAAFWFQQVEMVEELGLPVSGFIADVEPPLHVMHQVNDILAASPDFGAVVAFLDERYDRALFEDGRARLRAMITETQTRGFPVLASTLFLILDDFTDDDDDIQRVFDCPIDDMGWDEVTFQVYRSAFGDMLTGVLLQPGELLSPYVVYDYGRTAVERFGDPAGLDLGIVDHPDYQAAAELRADVAAARAAGVRVGRMNIYSFQGIMGLEQSAPDDWMVFDTATLAAPIADQRVQLLRAMIQSVDVNASLEP